MHVATQGIDVCRDAMLPTAKLQVQSGTLAGREFQLTKALTRLGHPKAQVAAVKRRTDAYYIVHVESEQPGDYPLVNGTKIGTRARALCDGDLIQIAGINARFILS